MDWKLGEHGAGVIFILALTLLSDSGFGEPVNVNLQDCNCETLSLVQGDENPVCGTDGLMYSSYCVASCQGVEVQGRVSQIKHCGDERFGIAHPQHFGEVATDVSRFAKHGFKYLGVANRTRQAMLQQKFMEIGRVESGDVKHEEDGYQRTEDVGAAQVDMIYTSDGHIFGRRSAGRIKLGEKVTNGGRGLKMMNLRRRHFSRRGVNESQIVTVFGDNGRDDRAEVTNTQMDPFKRVGYIDPIGCTGSLVGKRHVLTAGHCTYSVEHGVWYPVTFQFSPAKSNGKSPFGTVEYDNIMVKGCYTTAGLPECDFALIILKEDIGDRTGFFGLGLDCGSRSVNLHMAGYPSDKPNQSMWKESCGAASVSCSPDPKLIMHDCDVVRGTSGSPLWDDTQEVRAIHKGALYTRDSLQGNLAVYITPYVHDNIMQWLDQTG